MKNQVQLITDVDRLAGNRGGLKGLMTGLLGALFGGIDLLPFLLRLIAPMRVSTPWIIRKSIRALVIGMIFALWVEIVADLIVNHMSSASLQFKSFSRRGSKSPFAGMFLAYDRFPNGAREEDLLRIYRPRPGLPFTNALLESGERRPLWTTLPRTSAVSLPAKARAESFPIADKSKSMNCAVYHEAWNFP